MTYAAILEAYGYDRFVADARDAGATSFILVDIPAEQHPELPRVGPKLVAPTSTDERIAACAAGTDGWLYLVTVTRDDRGARRGLARARRARRARAGRNRRAAVRRVRDLDACPRGDRRGLADGVVVGSRAVRVAEEGPAALRDYVRSLRGAIDATVLA